MKDTTPCSQAISGTLKLDPNKGSNGENACHSRNNQRYNNSKSNKGNKIAANAHGPCGDMMYGKGEDDSKEEQPLSLTKEQYGHKCVMVINSAINGENPSMLPFIVPTSRPPYKSMKNNKPRLRMVAASASASASAGGKMLSLVRSMSKSRLRLSNDGGCEFAILPIYPNGFGQSRSQLIETRVFKSSPESVQTRMDSVNSEGDEKRKLRRMRNRENSQIYRQRKKNYVEELEEKVRIMASTIQHLTLENVVFEVNGIRHLNLHLYRTPALESKQLSLYLQLFTTYTENELARSLERLYLPDLLDP
ncbi:hypothetical protein H5410_042743 [Solanum commersonii]|uniref:BZIP domain-containing protein n=1 Tax=Solanum commersonii TaxID=4109 RepID=A0A9J5XWJ3_SOLCO|nr:hypothetical protein H5410_042743 [Solanum commersonii]